MKWLRNIVGDQLPLYSIIVFSERCTLKKINVTSKDVQVINRHVILNAVEHAGNMQSKQLSQEEINEIYHKLYPYTQVSEEQKLQHVHNIKTNLSSPQINHETVRAINETDDNKEVL